MENPKNSYSASFPKPTEPAFATDTLEVSENPQNPVEHWLREGTWPNAYSEQSNRSWKDIDTDIIQTKNTADQRKTVLCQQKPSGSLYQQSDTISAMSETDISSDKSLPYRSSAYKSQLASQRVYMSEASEGITENAKEICQSLLDTPQTVPKNTILREDEFRKTFLKLSDENEARVLEDISPLIAPSPERLAINGFPELEKLTYSINKRWTESVPLITAFPQPDRCVGFDQTSFTAEQSAILHHYIGARVPINSRSYFLATRGMYFPFFTCEVKGADGEIDIADRQNAHSMGIAVRGIVELLKLANCEQKLHREVVAFSISHNATTVRIYGYYPLIEESRTFSVYRHHIRNFDIAMPDGKDRWAPYKFTKNVYLEFMPNLLKVITAALDQITIEDGWQCRFKGSPQDINMGPEQSNDQQSLSDPAGFAGSNGKKRKRLTGNAVLQQQLIESQEEMKSLRERLSSGNELEAIKVLREQLDWQRQEAERRRLENENEWKARLEHSEKRCQTLLEHLLAARNEVTDGNSSMDSRVHSARI